MIFDKLAQGLYTCGRTEEEEMPDYYFTASPTSKSDVRDITVTMPEGEYRFQTDSGVFSRDGLDPGSRLLIENMPRMESGRILDLGCGWGAVGTILGRRNPGCRIVCSDVNERAVETARGNLKRNGVFNGECHVSDGLTALEGQFDQIALNPPIRAGKTVIYGLFAQARDRLNPGGSLTIVIRKKQGADSAFKELQTLFETVETIDRGGGYHIIRAGGAK